MVKASEAHGRKVVTRRGGRKVGKVEGVIIDPTGQELMGLLVHRSRFRVLQVVRWSHVLVFGPDWVVIESPAAVSRLEHEPDIAAVLQKQTQVRGLRLVTTHGHKLGKIVDLSFDETSGLVDGYELKSRLLSEGLGGTPFLPTPKWMELGKQFAVVVPESMDTIRASVSAV